MESEKECAIDDAQLSFFKTVEKSLNEASKEAIGAIDDQNEVFGRFITCVREQRVAKHEMENVLFKIQMQ